MQTLSSHVQLEPGQDFGEAVTAMLREVVAKTDWRVGEMTLPPGRYYARMARPNNNYPRDAPGSCPGFRDYEHELAIMQGQMLSLVGGIESICQVVHPSPATLDVYGHEIRNLLILACTEVEAHWRAVLRANGITRERLTTADYVQLQDAMKLGEYTLAFNYFPWLKPVSPFKRWGTTGSPTKELAWYDAYNAVKHDREDNFARATLSHALQAVAACAIMMFAQAGKHSSKRRDAGGEGFFTISSAPRWNFTEVYTPTHGAHPSIPVPYPFK